MPLLRELTRGRVRELAPRAVAVLPLGSQEQHGDHLPLGTDTTLVEAVVGRALDGLDDAVVCPAQPYGFSGHHAFAAAATLSPPTLLAVVGELLDSLVGMGFRRLLVVNGHGGNVEMMQQAVKVTALNHPVVAAWCSYWDLVEAGAAGPGHAGRFETSLMLAVRPDLVGGPCPGPAEPPLFDRRPVPGLHVERHGEWARCGGTTDSGERADAAEGERVLAAAAEALRACVRAVAETALPTETALPAETTRPAPTDERGRA